MIHPDFIRTDQRIFEVTTYDDDIYLCNLFHFTDKNDFKDIKGIKHYWNNKFITIGKSDVIEMLRIRDL